MRRGYVGVLSLILVTVFVTASAMAGGGPKGPSGASFKNFQLSQPEGDSEPAVSFGPDGTVVLGGLSWLLFQTNIWKGSFGVAPAFIGPIDAHIGTGIGGGDEDLDFGSTGTLHASTLMFFFNPVMNRFQLGVSAIACPNFAQATGFSNCKAQIIDTTQADRQWVTSDGKSVYISYHDNGHSALIHVQRSLDDGFTWRTVGNPIVGADGVTADSTFNNQQGNLVADPSTHFVFAIFAAGEPSIQKGTTANFNNIFVSRSEDRGITWTASLVFHAPLNKALNVIFPALAVDPIAGTLYASWSDAHNVFVSTSRDHGSSWSSAVAVNQDPVVTAIFPAIAARNGHVVLAYYGTTATSKDDPNAVWNTFMAQSDDGVQWSQSVVSDHPNHVGVICTRGTGCANPLVTRTLLDLFEVSISPVNGMAAVIYTDDTLTTFTFRGTTFPLPQVIVGYQTS